MNLKMIKYTLFLILKKIYLKKIKCIFIKNLN